jgi:hypothetical protein
MILSCCAPTPGHQGRPHRRRAGRARGGHLGGHRHVHGAEHHGHGQRRRSRTSRLQAAGDRRARTITVVMHIGRGLEFEVGSAAFRLTNVCCCTASRSTRAVVEGPALHAAGLRTLAPNQRGYSPGARHSTVLRAGWRTSPRRTVRVDAFAGRGTRGQARLGAAVGCRRPAPAPGAHSHRARSARWRSPRRWPARPTSGALRRTSGCSGRPARPGRAVADGARRLRELYADTGNRSSGTSRRYASRQR